MIKFCCTIENLLQILIDVHCKLQSEFSDLEKIRNFLIFCRMWMYSDTGAVISTIDACQFGDALIKLVLNNKHFTNLAAFILLKK